MSQQTTTGLWGSGNLICKHCGKELPTTWMPSIVRGKVGLSTASAPFCNCDAAVNERNAARMSRTSQFLRGV